MINFNANEIYSSLLLPQTYLNTALILTNYIFVKKIDWSKEFKKKEDYYYGKKYFEDIDNMFDPLYFNIKHWIELYCKTLLNLSKWSFDKKHSIKDNFCKLKCLCLELQTSWDIKIDIVEINKIEEIVKILSENDSQNTKNRYPNDSDFRITSPNWKKSKDKTFSDYDEYEWDLRLYKWKSRHECHEKHKTIIIELRDFFETILKEEYFEKKIKKRIKTPPKKNELKE